MKLIQNADDDPSNTVTCKIFRELLLNFGNPLIFGDVDRHRSNISAAIQAQALDCKRYEARMFSLNGARNAHAAGIILEHNDASREAAERN